MRLVYFLVLFITLVSENTICTDQCVYIKNGDADYIEPVNCSTNLMCTNASYEIVTLTIPPYSDDNILTDILDSCCGKCPGFRPRISNMMINDNVIRNLMGTIRMIADFVFPFLGNLDTKTLYGWYFIPVAPVPSFFYVTRNDANILAELVLSSLKLYPLIIICITLAVIAGFIIWILETWLNVKEFPRPFFVGWFEGFWWSFISMTTVGYGDKTPKMAVARIFSVMWIITGIALFNIVTGEITTILVKANNPPAPNVRGQRVGVLKFRDYDKSYVTKNGGLIYHVPDNVDNSKNHFFDESVELISLLRNKTIQGIILDKATMSYLLDHLHNERKKKETSEKLKGDIDFFFNQTLRTEKLYSSGNMAYGIIFKNKKHYDFFGGAIKDNRMALMSQKELQWNEKEGDMISENKANLFDPEGYYFLTGMKGIGGIIGCIVLIGILFEISRVMNKKKKKKENNENDPPKYEMNEGFQA